ncbi:MAG: hypothetical protein SGPRY_011179 [Prymnesium sp.]
MQAVWALTNLSSDPHLAPLLVSADAIQPLCCALLRHEARVQQQIMRSLGNLLLHEPASQQLANAALSIDGFSHLLLALLRKEQPDSPVLEAAVATLAAYATPTHLPLAALLVSLPGYGKLLVHVLRHPQATSKATLVGSIVCVCNMACVLLQLDDVCVNMLIFVKPLFRLLDSISVTVQTYTLMAINRIASLGNEQRRQIALRSEALMSIRRLAKSPSSNVRAQCLNLQALSEVLTSSSETVEDTLLMDSVSPTSPFCGSPCL